MTDGTAGSNGNTAEPTETAGTNGRPTEPTGTKPTPLLSVRDLQKHYPITKGMLKREVGRVRAVDGISFDLYPGETLGIVGESGCGKSTAATSLLRLEEPTGGEILFRGEDVTTFDDARLKRFRRAAQMVFQDPDSSFDPRMSVGDSVGEPLAVQGLRDRKRRRAIVGSLLERVGLTADDADRYPHEFSGGQKQRIGLARALSVNPDLIVADEPTSALDVSIQAEILSLMEDVQTEFGLAILLISHDLGVIRQVCDRVAVMYLGRIVEIGPTEGIFSEPQHPYTRALLSSIPTPNPRERGMGEPLTGDVPSPSNPPHGCRFHTRCPEVIQPDGLSLDRTEWRRVMDLRVRLARGGVDVASLLDTDADGDGGPATTDAIRRAFDVPDPLSEEAAERVLAEALEALVEGDTGDARELLDRAFRSPCEGTDPVLVETSAGHESACLLTNEERAVSDPTPADD